MNVRLLLEALHQSSLPFHEVVKSFERIVVGTHLWVVEVSEEQIEVPLEHTNDFFEFVVLLVFSSVPLQIREFPYRLFLRLCEENGLDALFDFSIHLRPNMGEWDDLSRPRVLVENTELDGSFRENSPQSLEQSWVAIAEESFCGATDLTLRLREKLRVARLVLFLCHAPQDDIKRRDIEEDEEDEVTPLILHPCPIEGVEAGTFRTEPRCHFLVCRDPVAEFLDVVDETVFREDILIEPAPEYFHDRLEREGAEIHERRLFY